MAKSPEREKKEEKQQQKTKKREKEQKKNNEKELNQEKNNKLPIDNSLGLLNPFQGQFGGNISQNQIPNMGNQNQNFMFQQFNMKQNQVTSPNFLINQNQMNQKQQSVGNEASKQLLNFGGQDLLNLNVESLETLKFPPSTQNEYRSVLLDYIISNMFFYPIHGSKLEDQIKNHFQKVNRNVSTIMESLNIDSILLELSDKNAIEIEKYCVGTKMEIFILDTNPDKLKQLAKEFSKDRPKVMPTLSTDTMMRDLGNIGKLPGNIPNLAAPVVQPASPQKDNSKTSDINQTEIDTLLGTKIGYQKVLYEQSEEISSLVNKQTAAEDQVIQKFKKAGQKIDFCDLGTKDKCRMSNKSATCTKAHFRKVIQPHTDENLGNCSYLDTCRHQDYCKFIHYELDIDHSHRSNVVSEQFEQQDEELLPHQKGIQWVECDIRQIDFRVLGKFDVIMADPPWDIHMNLPYDTMKDKEMKALRFDLLQDDGLLFLWVTGRAMELGRECMQIWGYRRVEELIWVKTNQLQRIIRTGRTGHWLNHSKEHCLVGIKGKPKINANVDCDVIVSEVRETSRKPDEIYHLIHRISPRGRKVELFGRPHNCFKGWMTLGNQLPGAYFLEPEIRDSYSERYPDIDCTQEQMDKNKDKFNSEQVIDNIYNSHIQNTNPPFKPK